jgi:hypothetical protein
MAHLDVVCQTIMNMPVQPSCTRKACKPWSFHQHHPISSHLVSCQPKHPSMLFFIFQLICSTPPSKCARTTGPKLNHLFVMASIACECSKTPSKDKTQPKCCCAFYHEPTSSKSAVIVVYQKSSLCTPSLGSKMRFSKDVYLQAAQKR